jgi:UDP-2-acetamido-2-deoxy-ribo-hexuluronate aminotransferase
MIQFIDLKSQYALLKNKIDQRIQTVLDHGQYIMGPEVAELENELAKYTGSKFAIGVSNGTDALQFALMALGIKTGDQVIVPDFSFFATVEVILLLGAVPIFVDVEEQTGNLLVSDLKAKMNPKVKAIIAVSLYGQCADFDEINEVASKYNVPVIEDGAQSFGASYKGKKSCNLTTIGATSFFPSKPLGCYGDGGACFTNDEELAKKMKKIRVHGQEKRYVHTDLGSNGRLDTLQAAILIEKLKVLDQETSLRQKIAKKYNDELHAKIKKPIIKSHNLSVYAQYTIRAEKRSELVAFLDQRKIPTAIHYPGTMSSQPLLRAQFKEKNINSEKLANEVLSLPFSPYLNEVDQNIIIKTVNEFFS